MKQCHICKEYFENDDWHYGEPDVCVKCEPRYKLIKALIAKIREGDFLIGKHNDLHVQPKNEYADYSFLITKRGD